ncbi:hypothetical protein Gotri_007671, partial [Gossypium trilobum]|nr:hypothetical protein [Gossypium trilobum]
MVMVGMVGVVLVAELEDVEEVIPSGVEDEAMVLEGTMTMVSLMQRLPKDVVLVVPGEEGGAGVGVVGIPGQTYQSKQTRL